MSSLIDKNLLAKKLELIGSYIGELEPIVGLRNAIVHRYEHVDLDRFIHELKRNFNDFKLYSILIAEKFLTN